jgi:hypothetical protein
MTRLRQGSGGQGRLRFSSGAHARLFQLVLAVARCAAWPTVAAAQDEILVGHLELSGGVGMVGGAALGSLDADLRSPTADQPYRLFTTTSRIAPAPVFDVRVGVALSQRYAVEGHLAYGRPELRTELSSDAESAPPITAVEEVDQYVIDGGLVVHFGPLGAGVRPFVTAGAGYVRELHEGRVVVEDGSVFYAGGGLKYGLMSRSDGLIKAVGLRGDARLNVLSGGIQVEDGVRRHVAVSGGVFLVF